VYTHGFNSSYFCWKDDISIKVAAYGYSGGLKVGDVMTNWHAGKYTSLNALQNDAAKIFLWRSAVVITPKPCSSITT
jgi:hypothetical protein